MRLRLPSARTCLLLALCASAFASCDFVGRVSGAYRGPVPVQEAITNEVAIVRSVRTDPNGGAILVLDRTRYLEGGNPHDVNRVVRAQTVPANQQQVAALALVPGERIVVSTTFAAIGDAAEMTEVPNWPGHGFYEYPIAVHVLTSIARAVP